MPTKEMCKQLRKKVAHGTYNIGEPIVPKKFHKLNTSGHYKEITVLGRKIPLKQIRQDLLKDHKDAGLLRPTRKVLVETNF